MNLIEINNLLNGFSEVSLSDIDSVQLMERKDIKYILNQNLIPEILVELKPFYHVLTIDKVKLHPYSTYYLDTAGLTMYHQHQNGKLNRYKLRFRSYDAVDKTYLELKFKTNKKETIKKRVEIPNRASIPDHVLQMIDTVTSLRYSDLSEKLTNRFNRITLVNHTFTERLTIDINLTFEHDSKMVACSSLAIAELKRTNKSTFSKISTVMKKAGIREFSLSKYCFGMMLMNPGLKYNNFKPLNLHIQKLVNEFKTFS